MKTLPVMAALLAALPAAAQATAREAPPPPPLGTRFKCEDGQDLVARFVSQDAHLIAIVDSGDGLHALPIRPWTGGPVKLTWSDGQRTLTWSPGVQIMWMDGATHRMCGRGMRH
jgi:hypothetical protein